MQTIPTYNVGPHMYQVYVGGSNRALPYLVNYRLWGAIGWQRGRAYNAQEWVTSRHAFEYPDLAHDYAKHLLRPRKESYNA